MEFMNHLFYRLKILFGHLGLIMSSFMAIFRRFLFAQNIICVAFFGSFSSLSLAEGLSANFQNVDIKEFINTVSKNLEKTIIVDPSVQGAVTIRSYEDMDKEQYYNFFLGVLQVYGFSALNMDDDVIKVIPERNIASAGVPLVDSGVVKAKDEVIVRIVPLYNVSGKELAPLLRQLNNLSEGSVIHYDPSNVILMTGRAAVVNQLVSIVEKVDEQSQFEVERVQLHNASSTEVVAIASQLTGESDSGKPNNNSRINATIVSDERTNSVVISGDDHARQRMMSLLRKLDVQRITSGYNGNTRVILLKYAKASELVNVLTGVSDNGTKKDDINTPVNLETVDNKDFTIRADEQTNALIITAPKHIMDELENVIQQLDLRRPQVLVEAIIAEVSDADGLQFGLQWMNTSAGGTNFGSTAGGSVTSVYEKGMPGVLDGMSGLATGFYRGNWAGLMTALQSENRNNILATPSIVTLDNVEAEFTVGQEVPVLTGSQTTSGDNVYNTVERKSVGIKLKVTPQINKGDSVRLDIAQEVSSVSEAATNSDLGPTFDTRVVRNAVLVGSGSTVVVGGLLDSTHSDVESHVPFLGKIPFIGRLFGATSKKASKRNLMLFIRPTIIRAQDNYDQLSDNSLEIFKQRDNQSDRKIAEGLEAVYKRKNQVVLDKILLDIHHLCSIGCTK
jgi:general secretion pathway protein D